MIGYLQGKVLDTDGKKAIVILESGIGYEVNYGYYLEAGSNCSLFIHHHMTDHDQSLWGFNSLEDKKMFELLKTVNKVGSSKAYPMISNIGTEGVIQAIMFDQASVLSQAPGIGKKMAEQIILSLKDKIENFRNTTLKSENTIVTKQHEEKTDSKSVKVDMTVMNDVLMALGSLGYKDGDVAGLVREQLAKGTTSSEDIIKNVLREL